MNKKAAALEFYVEVVTRAAPIRHPEYAAPVVKLVFSKGFIPHMQYLRQFA